MTCGILDMSDSKMPLVTDYQLMAERDIHFEHTKEYFEQYQDLDEPSWRDATENLKKTLSDAEALGNRSKAIREKADEAIKKCFILSVWPAAALAPSEPFIAVIGHFKLFTGILAQVIDGPHVGAVQQVYLCFLETDRIGSKQWPQQVVVPRLVKGDAAAQLVKRGHDDDLGV